MRNEHHDTTATPARSSGTGTLGKALEVLEIIALAPAPLRFTDILKCVDQPRGTLHRQLSNLVEEGLIELDEDHGYRPGLRLLKLAAKTWSKNTFRAVAEPHLKALHEATGETVHLGVMKGLEVVYIDKLESRQAVRMHSQVGNASPLYCTGIGKAMLALLDPVERERLAFRFDYVQHTQHTIASTDQLLNELDAIYASGVSYDREEHEPGILCAAAGIRSPESAMIAGISVTAPAYRANEEVLARWTKLVRQAANAIEQDMKKKMGPRSSE